MTIQFACPLCGKQTIVADRGVASRNGGEVVAES
jgi:predicted RNA-binding Zn-ribbon protein involved in translation (DUF1610 family)